MIRAKQCTTVRSSPDINKTKHRQQRKLIFENFMNLLNHRILYEVVTLIDEVSCVTRVR